MIVSATPQPKPAKNSVLAIWSLICGIVTFLGLGPLAALPAIVCGHLGLSAIRKAEGQLSGRRKAIAGLVMGYGGMVVSLILTVLVFQTIEEVKRAVAKNDEVWLVSALRAYYAVYGEYPFATSKSEAVTFSSDNDRLIDALRSERSSKSDQNPLHIDFYEGRESAYGPKGEVRDPWGHPYWIRICTNHDGRVANPYQKNAGPNPIPQGAIVWSLGPDGKLGAHGDGDGSVDVLSWQ